MDGSEHDRALRLPRRRVLQAGAATVAGVVGRGLWTPAAAGQAGPATGAAGRVGRVAHLTDVHVQPEHAGDRGFAACLRHMQAHATPDLVLFGGDAVMNVNEASPDRTRLLADVWRRVLRDELSLPIVSAIGNHDIPDTKRLEADRASDDTAKAWACDLLQMHKRYHSFDRFGWHFVVLDSVRVGGPHGYAGRVDDEQLDWLKADLAKSAAAGTPVLVMSHIPIVSVVGFFDGNRVKGGDWDVPRSYMHIDAQPLHELFVKSGNVRVCVSGHAHQLDRCDFDGITYACNGAVCGDWWGGTYHHTPAGYAVLDLFADGRCDVSYHDFGWTAVE